MLDHMKKQFQEVLKRAEEAEKKVIELEKKRDDYKRAYADAKVNLGKAMSDIEKLKGGPSN